jgi:signal peptidase
MQPQDIYFSGRSMNPTLKGGDVLKVYPYSNASPKRGDVVVFYPPCEERLITHRIIALNESGIRARGDNNIKIDPWIISPSDIIGKVILKSRGRKQRRIINGQWGYYYSIMLYGFRRIRSLLIDLLRPFYHWLLQGGVIRRWFPLARKMQIITLVRSSGTEMQLIMGKKVIGRLAPQATRWQIRPPFRLFVDETSLPVDCFHFPNRSESNH